MLDARDDGDWLYVPRLAGGDIEFNTNDLDEAAARWKRGEKKEALYWLERALGRDFDGLSDITPEQLR